MRVLKVFMAILVPILAVVALASGFVVIVGLGALAFLILFLRRLFTGKPMASVKVEVNRGRPAPTAREFNPAEAIDIEATPADAPPKSLGN